MSYRVTDKVIRLADIFKKRVINAPVEDHARRDVSGRAAHVAGHAGGRIDFPTWREITGDGIVTPRRIEAIQQGLLDEGLIYEQPDGAFVSAMSISVATWSRSSPMRTPAALAEPAPVSKGPKRGAADSKERRGAHGDPAAAEDDGGLGIGRGQGPAWGCTGSIRRTSRGSSPISSASTVPEARLDGAEQYVRWTLDFSDAVIRAGNQHELAVEYGNPEKPRMYGFTRMLEDALNLHQPDFSTLADGITVKQPEETELARANIEVLRGLWLEWVASHPDVGQRMLDIYNTRFNRTVERQYDGSHLANFVNDQGEYQGEGGVSLGPKDGAHRTAAFPGLSLDFGLYTHQLRAVWRILTTGNALLAHDTGAGKTFEMIIAAMEMRRTGRARKPMITVPTHLLSQWKQDILEGLSGRQAVGVRGRRSPRRQAPASHVADRGWRLGHRARAPFVVQAPEGRQETHGGDAAGWVREILAVEASMRAERGARDPTVKKLETRRAASRAKFATCSRRRRDAIPRWRGNSWVWMRCSSMRHRPSRTCVHTKLDRLRGLGAGEGSDQALNLYVKIKEINESSNYRNLVFATATPVMNSLVEVYTMQRYLQPQRLRELGFENFDNWYASFAQASPVIEERPDGSYAREVMRVGEFRNAKLLSRIAREMLDYVGPEDMPY